MTPAEMYRAEKAKRAGRPSAVARALEEARRRLAELTGGSQDRAYRSVVPGTKATPQARAVPVRVCEGCGTAIGRRRSVRCAVCAARHDRERMKPKRNARKNASRARKRRAARGATTGTLPSADAVVILPPMHTTRGAA